MRYLTFADPEPSSYEICFLVPQLNQSEILRYYVEPYLDDSKDRVIAYDLHKVGKKTPVKVMREYLDELLPVLQDLGIKYLVTCDADYYKTLTKATSTENDLGYVRPSVVGDFQVVYCPNFRAVFYDPEKVKAQIRIAMEALLNHRQDAYCDPGDGIIHFAAYPTDPIEIKTWLQRLLDMDCDLAADIEAFSLKHYSAGIGTISFAWTKHEGIAFPIDLGPNGMLVRKLLKDFFMQFRNRMMWHKINYDVYVLIYQLFMKDIIDTEGLLEGLSVMMRNWDDTRLITYLATNSCAGNKLGLKIQAQEFAGNYAVDDIADIRKIPLDDLLKYNLVDALSTWYVYEKHWQTLVDDQQLDIYENIFKPAMLDIIQMQLTGMPLDMEEVRKLKADLENQATDAIAQMQATLTVQAYTHHLNLEWVEWKNSTLKKKRVCLADAKEVFNPNSGPQLQELLYNANFLGLPVLDLTDSKLPATGAKTLKKLLNHTTDEDVLAFLKALLAYKKVDKLLTAFIPAFLEAPQGPDGWHYLFGYFNLGGTVSGRLSSSEPNLQNLPANDKILGKAVKRCFKAPPGWLFCGLDFASLEDRISALTTKDPNKLKVYTDGYDGHSLRAFSYFGEHMPDIQTAPEGARCFEVKIGDKRVWFHEYDQVSYLGQTMTGRELFDRLSNLHNVH